MKLLGFALVTLGFLGGAYFLTGVSGSVLGAWFIVSFLLAMVGVVILRITTRKAKGAVEKVTAEVQTTEQCLSRLASGVGALLDGKDAVNVYDLSHEIDKRFTDDLESFVEARESIAIAHGLPAYANIMNHFAAGERYLNRVWSCSVDGYIDEAHAFLERSRDQFIEGHTKLSALLK